MAALGVWGNVMSDSNGVGSGREQSYDHLRDCGELDVLLPLTAEAAKLGPKGRSRAGGGAPRAGGQLQTSAGLPPPQPSPQRGWGRIEFGPLATITTALLLPLSGGGRVGVSS